MQHMLFLTVGIQGGCTCQPFLLNSIFENLGAYGGPSGLWGSRAAVPSSRSSSTPSLRSGGLWRVPPPFAGMLHPLGAPQGTMAAQEGQWVGGHVERGDAPKDAYHFFCLAITAVCIIQGMRLFILKKNKYLVNLISPSILHRMI